MVTYRDVETVGGDLLTRLFIPQNDAVLLRETAVRENVWTGVTHRHCHRRRVASQAMQQLTCGTCNK